MINVITYTIDFAIFGRILRNCGTIHRRCYLNRELSDHQNTGVIRAQVWCHVKLEPGTVRVSVHQHRVVPVVLVVGNTCDVIIHVTITIFKYSWRESCKFEFLHTFNFYKLLLAIGIYSFWLNINKVYKYKF